MAGLLVSGVGTRADGQVVRRRPLVGPWPERPLIRREPLRMTPGFRINRGGELVRLRTMERARERIGMARMRPFARQNQLRRELMLRNRVMPRLGGGVRLRGLMLRRPLRWRMTI